MIAAPYKNRDHAPEIERRARSENFVRAAIATLQAIIAVAFVFGVLWLANWLTPPFKPEPKTVEPRPELPAAPVCGSTPIYPSSATTVLWALRLRSWQR